MGTCFSFLKRNMNMKRRHQQNYCLTPRSFYQHDTDVVELQYLVSAENSGGTEEIRDHNPAASPDPVSDMNENISPCSKEYILPTKKKKRILRRFMSWLEEKDDKATALLPNTEGDMMLRMMMSNSINKITPASPCDDKNDRFNLVNGDCGTVNDTSCKTMNVANVGCNAEAIYNSSSESYRINSNNNKNSNNKCNTYCVSNGVYSTSRSSHHSNVKSISYCSLKVASNSDSNSSSIDLEWEPEGNAAEGAVCGVNKSSRNLSYQHQSSEDSVELSLLSSAESLEWDTCEGAGVVLDSDTEQLIQEIERLTARALKETGSDFNFNCGNSGNITNLESNDSYVNR